jgi:uncharacterized protein YbaP (TraB family)
VDATNMVKRAMGAGRSRVGAAHYSGETGVLAQLAKKGFKVTRLTNADAGLITRKPTA